MSNNCVHSHVGVSLVDASGKIRPCCKFKHGWDIPTLFDVETLDNLHKRSEYATLQTELENGNWPMPCRVCKRDESVGIFSRRLNTNRMFDTHDLYTDGYIQDLEISLDFTCNMMCRMCAPGASSKWGAAASVITDYKNNGIELDVQMDYKSYQDRFKYVFERTDLSHARHLKIEGGEPFYAKHLEWFIDKLDREVIDKDKLYLSIFTNGSVFPDATIIEKLSRFKTTIIFSIDAYGDLASCLRWGVRWEEVEQNIIKWSKLSDQFVMYTNITVSILNVNAMKPLIDFCDAYGVHTQFSELTHPTYLSMYQLPLSVRQQWAFDRTNFNEILLADVSFDTQRDKLLKSTQLLDNYQGIKFADVNPEMMEIIDAYIR